MSNRKLLTLGALAGVGFGILEVAGVVVGMVSNPVPYDTFPSADTAARAAATPMPSGVWIGLGLEVVATLLLVAFMVRAVDAARGANGPTLLPTAAIFAGIVNVATIFVSFGIIAARYMGAGHGLDGQSMILLAHLTWGTYFLSWPSAAMFIGCLSAAALQSRALPGWVAWTGLVIAVLGIGGCLDPTNLGQLAQLPQLLWIPAAGIALAVRFRGAAQPSTVMIPA
jgi:hypothetical protein